MNSTSYYFGVYLEIASELSLYELLGDNEELASITPPGLNKCGVIIAVSNASVGRWLYLHWYSEIEQLDFPTDEDVSVLKGSFTQKHARVMKQLGDHPGVSGVKVRAGYVLDQEY